MLAPYFDVKIFQIQFRPRRNPLSELTMLFQTHSSIGLDQRHGKTWIFSPYFPTVAPQISIFKNC